MANNDFLAHSLTSKQLLALLYICETKRKGAPVTADCFRRSLPGDWHQTWHDMLDTFADRFANLTEELRFEVLEAHLMSVEDVDVYDDNALKKVLTENRDLLTVLTADLEKDQRFTMEFG